MRVGVSQVFVGQQGIVAGVDGFCILAQAQMATGHADPIGRMVGVLVNQLVVVGQSLPILLLVQQVVGHDGAIFLVVRIPPPMFQPVEGTLALPRFEVHVGYVDDVFLAVFVFQRVQHQFGFVQTAVLSQQPGPQDGDVGPLLGNQPGGLLGFGQLELVQVEVYFLDQQRRIVGVQLQSALDDVCGMLETVPAAVPSARSARSSESM